ncbi:MAG: TspO/MBR family protein [Pseudomonadota bacterium]
MATLPMRKTWALPAIMAAFAALAVAFMGAFITDLGPWYQALQKPSWNPPDALFPIGWTLIFALNTYAIVAAWRAAPNSRVSDKIIGLFALNAFLNITWSMLFFRLQRPDFAFIEVMLLWLSIAALVWYCGRYSKTAALAFTPYLLWVTFAGALNWAVVDLNGPFG